MTKKFAELTGINKLAEFSGTVSVLLASVILIFAILISPAHFPKVRVQKKHASSVSALETLAPSIPDQGVSKSAPIPAENDLSVEINEIFGTAVASKSNALFGKFEDPALRAKKLEASIQRGNRLPENFRVTLPVTQEEYELLLYCVGHETRNGSLKHKILITEVIFNRAQGPKFGATVKDVILARSQFSVMNNYDGWGDWKPDRTTLEAVNLVLSGSAPNYANGAVYFCNPKILGEGNWFDRSLKLVCEIEGHRFYK